MKISKEFNEIVNKNLRYFIGDVRDEDRLNFALRNVDYVNCSIKASTYRGI